MHMPTSCIDAIYLTHRNFLKFRAKTEKRSALRSGMTVTGDHRCASGLVLNAILLVCFVPLWPQGVCISRRLQTQETSGGRSCHLEWSTSTTHIKLEKKSDCSFSLYLLTLLPSPSASPEKLDSGLPSCSLLTQGRHLLLGRQVTEPRGPSEAWPTGLLQGARPLRSSPTEVMPWPC